MCVKCCNGAAKEYEIRGRSYDGTLTFDYIDYRQLVSLAFASLSQTEVDRARAISGRLV